MALQGILDQLGIESKFYRGDAKRQLQKEVEIIRGVQKKEVVIILDEAHLFEKETIKEFRSLLNYRFDSLSPWESCLIICKKNYLHIVSFHGTLVTDAYAVYDSLDPETQISHLLVAGHMEGIALPKRSKQFSRINGKV